MKNSTAIILLLISFGLYYTFTSVQWSQVAGLRTEEGNYTSVLQNVASLEEKRDELKVKYKNVPDSEVVAMNTALPSNADTVHLALDLDSMASKYGIVVKGVTTSNNGGGQGATNGVNTGSTIAGVPAQSTFAHTELPTYQPVSVSFSFVANYDNFRKFLADIEHSLRVTDVQSVEFSAAQNGSQGGLTEYRLTVQTYWIPNT